MKPLMDQMFQGHKAMDDLVASGTFDEAKARVLAAQQAQAFQEVTAAAPVPVRVAVRRVIDFLDLQRCTLAQP